jgi:hypothetical protein
MGAGEPIRSLASSRQGEPHRRRNSTESQMSKITVTVDAEGQDGFTFEWEGDPEDLQDSINDIESFAQRKGSDSAQLVNSALAQYLSTGPVSGPDGAAQRMAFLWAVLHSMNKHADVLPGPVLECLAEHNIIATVTIRDRAASIEVEGLPWKSLH